MSILSQVRVNTCAHLKFDCTILQLNIMGKVSRTDCWLHKITADKLSVAATFLCVQQPHLLLIAE